MGCCFKKQPMLLSIAIAYSYSHSHMKSLLLSLLMLTGPTAEHNIIKGIKSDATEHNKNIAVYFSGSDWCSNCHQFKSSVLDTKEISQLLADSFVFYTADFPQRKKLGADIIKANEQLAEALNPEGEFPVLVLADKDMHIISRIYKGNSMPAVLQKLKMVHTGADGK